VAQGVRTVNRIFKAVQTDSTSLKNDLNIVTRL
jgi:hypothetical protein